jgi:meiotically up-regulated gene 157 (Mug157) protein
MTETTETPQSIADLIHKVVGVLGRRSQIAGMFETCIKNTLNTTIRRWPDGTTYVITGDIPAMWLRDSAAQVRPYLVVAAEDEQIADMIQGLVERQFQFILHDPYANAFNDSPSGRGHQNDITDMTPWIWERKYEVDSLCYPIQLSYLLWKNTGRTAQFNESFRRAVRKIIALWRTEQHHETESGYRFQRLKNPEQLPLEGKGAPTAYTGMTWSGFRPSDDPCRYGYLIPSNMFAVLVLRYVAEIAEAIMQDRALAEEAQRLCQEIDLGIREHGVLAHPEYGRIFAFETDGLGNHLLMDDANVPSLLSIPYLGYLPDDDPIYQNTRRFILSENNPYFFKGKAAEGVGSPHTPHRYIWHIALAMQGLTAGDPGEKERLLQLLVATDAGAGMMHEGFDADDPSRFTRKWFSWANMMFCELVLDLCGIRVKKS